MMFDENKDYTILDEQHLCCDEWQFTYVCKSCEETMGCYFCEFDYDLKHECQV